MKRIFTLIAITAVALVSSAQTPQGFNYQAVVRNSSGQVVSNQQVTMKFNLMQGTPNSTPAYSEQHVVTTDDLGTVNLSIGQGTPLSGIFSQVDWSLGSYHLGIEVNIGQGFISMGTTQLMSVPYALYAERVRNPFGIAINAVMSLEGEQYALKIRYRVNPNPDDNYIESGYVIGLSPNVTVGNAAQTYNNFGEFSYGSDYSYTQTDGLQLEATYYIRGYVKKSDNTYVYGQTKTFVTTP